jgi:type IV secretion system protein VirB4
LRQQRWFDAWFVQHELARRQSDDARDLAQFCTALTRLLDGLEGVLPEVAFLTPEETLSYLHQCVSWDRHRVALPEVPMYLDVRLAGCDVHPGHTVRLGSQWLRPLGLVSWPDELGFHLPTALQQVDFPYRFTVRWLALGKTDAKRLLDDYMRKWQLQHKSLLTLVLEAITRQPGTKVNQDAVENAASIEAALGALETDQVSYGYCTPTVLVWGDTPDLLQARTRRMEQILQQQGCIAHAETVNAMAAWVGTLPGHVYHNVRKPPLPSLSLAYLMPHGAVWAGPSHDAHVQGPPLFVASTDGVPFRFVLHQGEVGNVMLLGPTRTGKSALLAFMAMQFVRYPQAQVFLFDKNYALKCVTLAAGGAHYALGGDATRGVQPLGRIDRSEAERRWAQEWLQDLFTAQGFVLTPDEQGEIWQALQRLAQQPPPLRRLSVFHTLFQVQRLKPALQAFMEGGRYAFFDAPTDSFDVQQWTCFETNELLELPAAVPHALSYIFHRLEARFTGVPTLVALDEGWKYLDHPVFAPKIADWLKARAKSNVAVVLSTQEVFDAERTTLWQAIQGSCATWVYLPNPAALNEDVLPYYRKCGLTDAQIALIAHSRPRRDYLYVSPAGCRLFQLPLGAVELALCASSTPEDLVRMAEVSARHHERGEPYPAAWLRAKGLDWAAEIFNEQRGGQEEAGLASAACQAHPEELLRFLTPVAPSTGG